MALLLLLAGCALPPQAPMASLVDSIGIRFVRVPAGEFMMGSAEPAARLAQDFPRAESQRLAELADEAPVHRVRITRPFLMGATEVTVGQFRRFVELSGHVAQSEQDGGGYGFDAGRAARADGSEGDAFAGRDARYSWRDPGFPQGDDHPVVNVSWHDAEAMARWLSAKEGVRYRLPTEAEWEYAARGGTTTRWPHGNDPGGLLHTANVFDADAAAHWPRWRAEALPGRDGFAFTAPVASFAPNAFGLHDMVGNVWEWCSDWYADDAYATSAVDDPQGPAEGHVKVRRGGSWHTWPLYARVSYRNWNARSTRYTLLGFRLVREVADGR